MDAGVQWLLDVLYECDWERLGVVHYPKVLGLSPPTTPRSNVSPLALLLDGSSIGWLFVFVFHCLCLCKLRMQCCENGAANVVAMLMWCYVVALLRLKHMALETQHKELLCDLCCV